MKPNWIALFYLFLTGVSCITVDHSDAPFDLRCEHQSAPLNVFRDKPSLSWRSAVVQQGAYQIQVASRPELLEGDKPELWDSGRVASPLSVGIAYGGRPLLSRQSCFWRVRVWREGENIPGSWSRCGKWEMGLLEQSDWRASWIRGSEIRAAAEFPALTRWLELAGISYDKEGKLCSTGAERLRLKPPATWLKTSFSVNKPVRKARLYSTAAGYMELFLDDIKVSNRVMNPGQTDFEKRILYDVDAVESWLSSGTHTIRVHLGDGFYGQDVAFRAALGYGLPSALVQLEITYEDGSRDMIVSDESWLSQPSQILKNNVYAGEFYDARLRAVSTSAPWKPVEVLTTPPTEQLEAQLAPPVVMDREVKPVKIYNPGEGIWVFDFGRNFTGVPTLHIKGALLKGTALYLRYAEWADEKGNISQLSDGAFATTVHQVDCYVTEGEPGESWTPTFTWHGFRYIELSGFPGEPGLDLLTAHLVRSGVKQRGGFECSDPHLNRIHETALWTYESNLISIPSDCPIRERCGWTGDAHATLTMSNYNFDMASLWQKYLGDFRTSRHVSPSIVPGKRTSNSNPDWAVAQVLVAWEHYLNHADVQLLRNHYAGLNTFMKHYHSMQKDGIVTAGYGDWCDPVRKPGTPRVGGAGKPQQTPPEITSSALFIYASDIMHQIAGILGDAANEKLYAGWRDLSITGFNAAFYDAGKKSYGSQTADSMALCFGIVPEDLRGAVAASLNHNVLNEWDGHASVGALGHRWLYPALSDAGYADTALGTFYAEGHPGFHYLFDDLNGSSLWERKGAFDPATMDAPQRSLSHPFQGGYDAWFYMGLGGIRPDPEVPGYRHFFLKPVFPSGLKWVKVDLETDYGLIKSHWQRDERDVRWKVCIPCNTTATVELPDGRTFENVESGDHRYKIIM